MIDLKINNEEILTLQKRIKEFEEERELIRFIQHEINAPLGAMNGFTQILNEDYEEGKELIPRLYSLSRKITSVNEVMKTFYKSKEELSAEASKKRTSKLAEIIKENSEIFLPNLKNREIQIYHRNEAFSKVNYELTDMLLGTIIGDTVKWNPEGEIAKFAINDKDEFYEILFENYYEKEMIYLNIGLNKGLGTKIIDYCIKKTGFEIEHYKEKRINPSLYPKVKKIGKITQPLEDSSKIIGLHGTKIVIPKVL